MNKKTVYIVHAVDVEGPMTEKIEATEERMRAYGFPRDIKLTEEILYKIQDRRFSELDKETLDRLSTVFNRHSLAYLNSWEQIDSKILSVTSDSFRNKYCSKDGNPYMFSWFIYDHHDGFKNNPRFHDVGVHHIFDHYMNLFLNKNPFNDGVYWHYHHPAISGDALESNTCWTNRPVFEEIIARRIIERNWYFSVFRAGLHIERNDMSHWLEMFIPFDFSARYASDQSIYSPGSDFDWRDAKKSWLPWNPDWYDYRKSGNMKRWLFRCTDLWTYLNILTEDEVEEAFEEASDKGCSVLTYYNHDYRDMKDEISGAYDVIKKVSGRYPDIEWKFVNALDAAREVLNLKKTELHLNYTLNENLLIVKADNNIFGPQPFLAIKESGKFFRDNFTDEGNNVWAYRFRKMKDVEAFGVAASTPDGNIDIIRKLNPYG